MMEETMLGRLWRIFVGALTYDFVPQFLPFPFLVGMGYAAYVLLLQIGGAWGVSVWTFAFSLLGLICAAISIVIACGVIGAAWEKHVWRMVYEIREYREEKARAAQKERDEKARAAERELNDKANGAW